MSEPTMPFGKHRGKPLARIPKGYLKWASETCDLRPHLRAQVEAVLEGKPPPPRPEGWAAGGDDWYLSDGVTRQIEAMFARRPGS